MSNLYASLLKEQGHMYIGGRSLMMHWLRNDYSKINQNDRKTPLPDSTPTSQSQFFYLKLLNWGWGVGGLEGGVLAVKFGGGDM